ncbi:A/G-specific adenine glycosylase [Dysgonomonas sp. OttesenSCG-928-M03]|nr:A/G-specific adenine glycosylase [Dysgonomonas sp. OttesenSCG-928-M03]
MSENYSSVSDVLIKWYLLNKRDLPWRDTKDPYYIWISEVILQQTRVVQGYDYYQRFVKSFPDVVSLANADNDEVMKLWQGLGYYSRARNLHEAAKTVLAEYNGVFPSRYEDIIGLKGVGEYTAAAIASFSFDLPYAVVDGNVYRVLSRLFAIDEPMDSTQGKKLFRDLAHELLDKKDPGLYNQAVMEFGALQCVPVSPDCENCPFSDICLAYAKKEVSKYPVKQGKIRVKERYFNYFDIRHEGSLYLNKRTGNDIWKNLYELPLIETDKNISFEELRQTTAYKDLFEKAGDVFFKSVHISLKHILSHRIIYANFYKIEISDDKYIANQYKKIKEEELDGYAISRLVDRYFELGDQSDLFSQS